MPRVWRGIVFNETSLPTLDRALLAEAGYDPYAYMQGLQADMLAAVDAAPRLPILYYHEGGFRQHGRRVGARRNGHVRLDARAPAHWDRNT